MNTLQQSATSPDETFNKEECHKELRAYRRKLFDLQNMFYADGRELCGGEDSERVPEAMPLKFPRAKKAANNLSIVLQ